MVQPERPNPTAALVDAPQRQHRKVLRELQLILDHAGMGIAYVRHRVIERCNQRFAEIYGYAAPDELRGRSSESLYLSADAFQALGQAAYPKLASGQSYCTEIQMRRSHGQAFWCSVTGKLIDPEQPDEGSIWIIDDVDARKQAEAQRDALLADQHLIFENALVGIVFLQNRVATHCNRRFEEIFGYQPGELLGSSSREWYLSEQDWLEAGRRCYEPLLRGLPFEGEMLLRTKSGQPLWCQVMAKAIDPADLARGSVWITQDITERKRAEAEVARVHGALEAAVAQRTQTLNDTVLRLRTEVLHRQRVENDLRNLAYTDTLTGLPNRLSLSEEGAQALAAAQQAQQPLAVMCLDLDHFKNINDSLGHEVGDQLLRAFAQKWRNRLPADVLFGRMSGDRFIFLFPDVTQARAVEWADRMLGWSQEGVEVAGQELVNAASLGVALYPDHGSNFDQLTSRADTALNQAKADGRRLWRMFSAQMLAQSERVLELHSALRHALERNQFELHYQPQFDLHTGAITGAEALLRWAHPELGRVSPAEFIPVAEDTGLILSIGDWVLRTAARQLQTWRAAGLPCPRVSVNLSMAQFRHSDLVSWVRTALQTHQLPPECLELELTERVTMDDALGALAVIAQLHDLGVVLAIDDFGTGYSSLSYLKRLAVQRIKIDQSFVRDLETDPDDVAIVAAILGLAQRLGLGTIAEGVETSEQARELVAMGCTEVQGYLYSRPLSVAAFEAFARTWVPRSLHSTHL